LADAERGLRKAATICFAASTALFIAAAATYWFGVRYAIGEASQAPAAEDSGFIILPWVIYALVIFFFGALMAVLGLVQFLQARKHRVRHSAE